MKILEDRGRFRGIELYPGICNLGYGRLNLWWRSWGQYDPIRGTVFKRARERMPRLIEWFWHVTGDMVYRQIKNVDKIFEWAGDWHEWWMKGAQHGLADNTGIEMGDGVCRPSARCGGKSRGCANLGFCRLRFVGGGGM